jgi:precorrin-3B synthase
MTMLAAASPYRRGACPGLSAPMPTGDGLLVRILPTGTISLAAFAALCEAARRHGNGIIEVTSRGNIQVRGLSDVSAPEFADAVAALDIAANDSVPVLCDALAGLEAAETFNSAPLAAELRHAMAQRGCAANLSPKVSVVVDGGGPIGLADIAADIRLRADCTGGDVRFHVSLGGDETHATPLGHIAPAHAVEAALRLCDVIARHGRAARARDILAGGGAAALREAIDAFVLPSLPRHNRSSPSTSVAIGTFPLRNGTTARGIGLAFGHTDASSLERLIEAAQAAGAIGLRTAPGRTLLALGVTAASASAFAVTAAGLGFVVEADDPRRGVIACAGAPVCASAYIASRALAPAIAATGAPRIGTVHISGCAKGCARSAAAALTAIGTAEGCALVAHGSVRDTPFVTVPVKELIAAIERHVGESIRDSSREAARV